MTSGENTYYYFNDALGSVRNLVDANEVAQNTYDYRAFGENLSATENITSPYRFTARDYEPGGLSQAHYYRNRYYMPGTGIFMSRDALEYDTHQGWGYVDNNPMNGTDPDGQCIVCVIVLIAAAAIFEGCSAPSTPPIPKKAMPDSCKRWRDKIGNGSRDWEHLASLCQDCCEDVGLGYGYCHTLCLSMPGAKGYRRMRKR